MIDLDKIFSKRKYISKLKITKVKDSDKDLDTLKPLVKENVEVSKKDAESKIDKTIIY